MLDEPLGSSTRPYEQLVNNCGCCCADEHSAIYVTHDQEAFAVSDRLILLHNRLIEQRTLGGGV